MAAATELRKGEVGFRAEPEKVVVGQLEPWKFGLALLALGVLWGILPPGAHWPLAALLILGALLAANRYADEHGMKRPLKSIYLVG